MAIGKASDFKIYHEYFNAAFTEVMMQQSGLFNEASGGAIRLIPIERRGDYAYESFFTEVSNMVVRRDTTSTSALTATALSQEENISVKLNYRTPYVAHTIDAFRKQQLDPQVLSGVAGQQFAKALMLYYLNFGLKACVAALVQYSTTRYDATNGVLQYGDLNEGLFKLGDNQNAIRTLVMRSIHQKQLIGDSITNYKFDNGAGLAIHDGIPGTMNRAALVTDSADLVNTDGVTSGTDSYYLLGLVPGAITVEETEPPIITTKEPEPGNENMFVSFQAEGAFNLSIKGFKWDVTNGGANPNATAVALGTNWDATASDSRGVAGVIVESQ